MTLRTKVTPMGVISLPYKNNEVIFESNIPGTYETELLLSAYFSVSVIGGGGGAAGTKSSNSCAASAGASGSGFIGIVKLQKGKLTIDVGKGGQAQCWLDGTCNGETGGTSTIKNVTDLISSPGGGGGHTWWRSGANPASLGALPTVNVEVVKEILNRQGNKGTNYNSGPGGASIITGSVYGKGGDTSGWGSNVEAYPGSAGYIKIAYVSGNIDYEI